jgi:hypothetical protein
MDGYWDRPLGGQSLGLSRRRLQLLREQVEEQPVLPDAVRVAPVAAQHSDALEANRLVTADRLLVRRRGVDHDPVVAALIDEPARQRSDRVAAEAATVQTRIEKEVDPGVAVLGIRVLVDLP